MGKPKQKTIGLMEELKEYMKKNGTLILTSMIMAIICYGFLVFSGNIRIDTEELINHPGSKLGWLSIGRFGLAFLKNLLGLSAHHVIKSGILFFLFFWIGANLITFAIYHFSGGKEYPYWMFLLLYVTSNIWSYQVYFSVQQAEVACAMLLLVAAAIFSVRGLFETRGKASVWRLFAAFVFLILGLGAYQALATYYISLCIVFFLAWLEHWSIFEGTWRGKKTQNRKMVSGIVGLLLVFGISYIVYNVIANTWFMGTAGYMEEQVGWGKYPVVDCIKNVLRTIKNVLLGIGPRNFSFYALGILFIAVLATVSWRLHREERKTLHFWMRILAIISLLMTPFFMTIYMGEMLVTRSQFALPVVSAFLGMCVNYGIREWIFCCGKKKRCWIPRMCSLCVVFVIVMQCGYNLRLAYTDEQRFQSDAKKADLLLEMLQEENGGRLPEQPIIFVGYQEADMEVWCRRTEMYGWSFFGWDYSPKNPTGATHRIVGFVQAYTGTALNENASEKEKVQAITEAEVLADFPSDDSIAVTEDFVVVRLSEIRERMKLDWW